MLPGLQRTSVFDRLGAEMKADTTTGSKVRAGLPVTSDTAKNKQGGMLSHLRPFITLTLQGKLRHSREGPGAGSRIV